jgi:hypothetical protein
MLSKREQLNRSSLAREVILIPRGSQSWGGREQTRQGRSTSSRAPADASVWGLRITGGVSGGKEDPGHRPSDHLSGTFSQDSRDRRDLSDHRLVSMTISFTIETHQQMHCHHSLDGMVGISKYDPAFLCS